MLETFTNALTIDREPVTSTITVSRQELYESVWKEPVTTLAKRYGISDVGLRKVCKRMNIPLPKSGHWTIIRSGKNVATVPLSSNYSGNKTVTFSPGVEIDLPDDHPRKIQIAKLQELKQNSVIIQMLPVPDKLYTPHKLIEAARSYLQKKVHDHRYPDMYFCPKGVLDIRVSQSFVGRALLFMDTLIKILEKLGHTVGGNSGRRQTEAIINGEIIPIRLVEKMRMIEEESRYGRVKTYVGRGELSFQMDNYPTKEWHDTSKKKKLENYLLEIVAALETRSIEIKIRNEKHLQRQREQEKREREIKEAQERHSREKGEFQELEGEAIQWMRAQRLRRYINAVERQFIEENGELDDNISEWLQWARLKCNSQDLY